ncbi:MAG: hypothetical protein OHK0038_24940 [Flammeovirgaceae bacterium]
MYVLSSCSAKQSPANVPSKVKQGIVGKLVWKEGNHMPQIVEKGSKPQMGKTMGIRREIFVYEPTKMTDTKGEAPFFIQPRTKRVAIAASNSDGDFKIALPVGKYSIFVREEKGLFANAFDGEGYICLVEVKENQITEIEIIVDYQAAY